MSGLAVGSNPVLTRPVSRSGLGTEATGGHSSAPLTLSDSQVMTMLSLAGCRCGGTFKAEPCSFRLELFKTAQAENDSSLMSELSNDIVEDIKNNQNDYSAADKATIFQTLDQMAQVYGFESLTAEASSSVAEAESAATSLNDVGKGAAAESKSETVAGASDSGTVVVSDANERPRDGGLSELRSNPLPPDVQSTGEPAGTTGELPLSESANRAIQSLPSPNLDPISTASPGIHSDAALPQPRLTPESLGRFQTAVASTTLPLTLDAQLLHVPLTDSSAVEMPAQTIVTGNGSPLVIQSVAVAPPTPNLMGSLALPELPIAPVTTELSAPFGHISQSGTTTGSVRLSVPLESIQHAEPAPVSGQQRPSNLSERVEKSSVTTTFSASAVSATSEPGFVLELASRILVAMGISESGVSGPLIQNGTDFLAKTFPVLLEVIPELGQLCEGLAHAQVAPLLAAIQQFIVGNPKLIQTAQQLFQSLARLPKTVSQAIIKLLNAISEESPRMLVRILTKLTDFLNAAALKGVRVSDAELARFVAEWIDEWWVKKRKKANLVHTPQVREFDTTESLAQWFGMLEKYNWQLAAEYRLRSSRRNQLRLVN